MTETSHKVLVATDGSPVAHAAAYAAIEIAKALDLVVQGLYAVDEILALDPYASYQSELDGAEDLDSRSDIIAHFEQQGQGALQWLKAECLARGVPIVVEMEMGGVSETILSRAKDVQLLVLGRRGHGHPQDTKHLGRTFQDVAHQAHPAMLVGGDKAPPLRRLLLAYNGSPHAKEALVWTARLQDALALEIVTLAVAEDGADQSPGWLEAAQAGLEQCGLGGCQFLTRSGQPAAEIVTVAKEKAADLIVMGGYRHKALLEWVIGSTVDRVLRRTPLPVLVA